MVWVPPHLSERDARVNWSFLQEKLCVHVPVGAIRFMLTDWLSSTVLSTQRKANMDDPMGIFVPLYGTLTKLEPKWEDKTYRTGCIGCNCSKWGSGSSCQFKAPSSLKNWSKVKCVFGDAQILTHTDVKAGTILQMCIILEMFVLFCSPKQRSECLDVLTWGGGSCDAGLTPEQTRGWHKGLQTSGRWNRGTRRPSQHTRCWRQPLTHCWWDSQRRRGRRTGPLQEQQKADIHGFREKSLLTR